MYATRLRQVADAIEAHKRRDVGFNMQQYCTDKTDVADNSGHNCGTKACIAGWAALESGVPLRRLKVMHQGDIHDCARVWLGLSDGEAGALFVPADENYRAVAPVASAVATLRLAAVTKRIQWVTPLEKE